MGSQSFTTMLNYSEMVRHSEWQKAQHEIWAEDIQKQILEVKNKPSGQRICSDPKSLGALMLMFITFLVAIALLMVLTVRKTTTSQSSCIRQEEMVPPASCIWI